VTRPIVLWIVLTVQIVCAVFFAGQIFSSVLGLRPLAWRYVEVIELGAVVGLLLGIYLGAVALLRTQARNKRVEGQLRAASGAFMELVADHFDRWDLTPAERDVALFAIKGLTTAEIASLRDTSEGTVKAQTNAIYRKAEVSNRSQLVSLFIEELIDGPLPSNGEAHSA